ncbi:MULTISPECIES: hypothetical protein [Methylobacterium]|uniref:Uncharacterized protein n=1 Tax=Methylobacterium thuringiense TaxID=1003091 RepID=A0ABQ4TKT5_9HYPH|nr:MULTISPECIES: hypothetical protein [Methylobacterium]TXN20212.1 hypothetical protein FV217_18835 [Methylobacterium sp. WL9]GJE55949.1 hypothetical protein EKPJFOCH_2446 [Methylobacterium thuringiense]
MASDTEKHQELLSALKTAQGQGDGSFERAVTAAFAHVFEHLEHLNTLGGPDEEGRPLKPGESSTLR